MFLCFLYIRQHPQRSTLFPYTTLFRSDRAPIDTIPSIAARSRQPSRRRTIKDERSRRGTARHCDFFATATNHHEDRKSTRLNSSHMSISYAVFCLKKKKTNSTKSAQTI